MNLCKISFLAASMLVLAALLVGCTKTVYVPYTPPAQAPTTTIYIPPSTVYAPPPPPSNFNIPPTSNAAEVIWAATPNQLISYGNWSPITGIYVPAGRTLSLSWSADNKMDSFIFTETQYLNFKPMGLLSGYMAHDTGSQGTITAYVQNGDTYYAVVRNQLTLGSVKLYQATLTKK